MTATLSTAVSRDKVKTPDESYLYTMDMQKLFRKTSAGVIDESLTGGTATCSCVSAEQLLSGGATVATGDLTIASVAVNSAALLGDSGQVVSIGYAIQARITGGVAGGRYKLKFKCVGTTQSNTLEEFAYLQVQNT